MSSNFLDYLGGAGLNLLVALCIVRFIYYPATQDKGYVVLFLTFNTVIYFVMAMLTSISAGIGVGFGLFAVFSFLRYRTEDIPIREITYLFVMIALPLINSAIPSGENWGKIVLANGATVLMLYVLEREWGFKFESSQVLTYEVIDLIKPQNHPLLLEDLRKRTGLPVKRVEVSRIDFLRDTAQIRIYYDEQQRNKVLSAEVGSDKVAVIEMGPTAGILAATFSSEGGGDGLAVEHGEPAVDHMKPVIGTLSGATNSEGGGDGVAVEHSEPAVDHMKPVIGTLSGTTNSEGGSNGVAVNHTRTIGIITVVTLGCVLAGAGGFVVGLSGLLPGGH